MHLWTVTEHYNAAMYPIEKRLNPPIAKGQALTTGADVAKEAVGEIALSTVEEDERARLVEPANRLAEPQLRLTRLKLDEQMRCVLHHEPSESNQSTHLVFQFR